MLIGRRATVAKFSWLEVLLIVPKASFLSSGIEPNLAPPFGNRNNLPPFNKPRYVAFSSINVITKSNETLVNWGAKEEFGVYCSEKDQINHQE